MALTIVATAGSASANSFATLSECLTYLGGRLNADSFEDSTSVDNQNRALVDATRELTLLKYTGTRTDAVQALSWPRQYAVDPDAPSPVDPADPSWPVYFDSDEIPQRIKDATCELALEFMRAGTTDIASIPSTSEVIRKKVDVLETEYARPEHRRTGLDRFRRVMNLVGPLLDRAATGGLDLVRT